MRTPSMTPAQAETAIGYPRGKLPTMMPVATRTIVRKWYSARDLPSVFNGRLNMRELAAGYNDENEFKKLAARFHNSPFGKLAATMPAHSDRMVDAAPAKPNGSNGLEALFAAFIRRDEIAGIVNEQLKDAFMELAAHFESKVWPL